MSSDDDDVNFNDNATIMHCSSSPGKAISAKLDVNKKQKYTYYIEFSSINRFQFKRNIVAVQREKNHVAEAPGRAQRQRKNAQLQFGLVSERDLRECTQSGRLVADEFER